MKGNKIKLLSTGFAGCLVFGCSGIEIPTGAASSSTSASPTPTATVQICPTSGCTSSQNDPNKMEAPTEPKKETKEVKACPPGGCDSVQNKPK